MDALKILAQTQQGRKVLRQIVSAIEKGKLRVQTHSDLAQKANCRASFYTDGIQGTIFVDSQLQGYAGALVIYHEFIHALDEDYRLARLGQKERDLRRNPRVEIEAEKKAYRAVFELIQELKNQDPEFCNYLAQTRAQGVDLDRVFSEAEIARAHGFSDENEAA